MCWIKRKTPQTPWHPVGNAGTPRQCDSGAWVPAYSPFAQVSTLSNGQVLITSAAVTHPRRAVATP